MAADIYGYAGRQIAWHREGQVLPNAETMNELHLSAGMDFEYKLMPLYWEKIEDEDEYHIMLKNKRLVTINGETSLDFVVNPDFQFHQPRELAGVIDQILEASKDWGKNWKPETAVALGKGETTCYCISLGDAQVGGTECMDYLIVTDTVDGKHALTAAITRVKVVCSNTLRIALSSAQVQLNVKHTRNHRNIFRSNVEGIIASQGKIHEAMTNLAAQAVNEKLVNDYLNKLFEVPEKEDERWSQSVVKKMGLLRLNAAHNFYRLVEQEKEEPTKWVLFNAAQETIEHSGLLNSQKVAIKSLLTGKGETVAKITEAFVLVNAF